MISQMKKQVEEIIESMPAEILHCVIGEFSRSIRIETVMYPEEDYLKSKSIDVIRL